MKTIKRASSLQSKSTPKNKKLTNLDRQIYSLKVAFCLSQNTLNDIVRDIQKLLEQKK